MPEFKQAARDCAAFTFTTMPSTLNQFGVIPFGYRNGTTGRHHNWKATAAFAFLVTFAVTAAVYAVNFKHAADREQHVYEGMNRLGRQITAGLSFFVLSLATGVTASVAHFLVNFCRANVFGTDLPTYKIDALKMGETERAANADLDDSAPLLGENVSSKSAKFVNKLGVIVSPPSLPKTFVWFASMTLVGFTVGNAARSDVFHDIADSQVGFYGGVISMAAVTAATAAATAVGAHGLFALGLNAKDRCVGNASQFSARDVPSSFA